MNLPEITDLPPDVNLTVLTDEQLQEIAQKNYYAGFATGSRIAKENTEFELGRKHREDVLRICDRLSKALAA